MNFFNTFLFFIIPIFSLWLVLFSNISVFERIRNTMNDASSFARFNSWEKGFFIAKQTGFIGTGYNLYGAFNGMFYGIVFESSGYANDSSLIQLFVTSGLIGTIVYIYHYCLIFKNKYLPKVFKVGLIAFIIICNFNNLLFYTLWIVPFYCIMFMFMFQYNNFHGRSVFIK